MQSVLNFCMKFICIVSSSHIPLCPYAWSLGTGESILSWSIPNMNYKVWGGAYGVQKSENTHRLGFTWNLSASIVSPSPGFSPPSLSLSLLNHMVREKGCWVITLQCLPYINYKVWGLGCKACRLFFVLVSNLCSSFHHLLPSSGAQIHLRTCWERESEHWGFNSLWGLNYQT